MKESDASLRLRSMLLRYGIRARRIEDRLGGFPDMIAACEDTGFVFGIETKVWKTFQEPMYLGLRKLQIQFIRESFLPCIVVALKKEDLTWSVFHVARLWRLPRKPGHRWPVVGLEQIGLEYRPLVKDASLQEVCETLACPRWCEE